MSSSIFSRKFDGYRRMTIPLSSRHSSTLSALSTSFSSVISRSKSLIARASSSRLLLQSQPRRMRVARESGSSSFLEGKIDEVEKQIKRVERLREELLTSSSCEDANVTVQRELADLRVCLNSLRENRKTILTTQQVPSMIKCVVSFDRPIADFWTSLREAEENGSFLELKNGTYFMGEKEKGSSLLIRESYRGLTDMISRMIDGKVAFKFVVTGSPGTGKSYFLLYIMWRLVQNSPADDPPTIVVQQRGKLALCFQGSKVIKGSIESFETQLENPNTWLLVDGMEPVFRTVKTIVFTSPNSTIYRAFLKEKLSTKLFMPVWSLDELQACRDKLYAGTVSPELLDDLYFKWGGRPRYVLEKAHEPSHQAEMEGMIGYCDPAVLLRSMGENHGDRPFIDTLLQIEVGEDFLSRQMQFSSKLVAERIFDMLVKYHFDELQQFLMDSNDRARQAMRGLLIEKLAHLKLPASDENRVQRLRINEAGAMIQKAEKRDRSK